MSIVLEASITILVGTLIGFLYAMIPAIRKLIEAKTDFYKTSAEQARINMKIAQESLLDKKRSSADSAAVMSSFIQLLDRMNNQNNDDE